MVSVKSEINEILYNTITDLENRLEESRNLLNDVQKKMDEKVSEAKEYKISVDDAKENIKRLESEIKVLENDLVELKEKYGKKNLVALIEAGTKEINHEIKKKHDEIQIHKNKIAELTNRARSIKDLLFNLKKDKQHKEEKLSELENCAKYYKSRLEDVIEYSENHEDLNDYFEETKEESDFNEKENIFEDIVSINKKSSFTDEPDIYIDAAEEVFNDVIINNNEKLIEENDIDFDSPNEVVIEDSDFNFEDIVANLTKKDDLEKEELKNEIKEPELEENNFNFDTIIKETKEEFKNQLNTSVETENIEQTNSLMTDHDLEINNLFKEVNATPIEDKITNINNAIDNEFANVFGSNINEPIKTLDIFGNEYTEIQENETDIVNKLTNIGLDFYAFNEKDRDLINTSFNDQTISEIVRVLNENKIALDNLYVDAKILTSITPTELSNIISKLINAGQSSEAIGFALDKLPLIDAKKLETTINNYGDYIKNIDITDIIIKSLKGDN